MSHTSTNGKTTIAKSGWLGSSFSNNYKEFLSTGHFAWKQTSDAKIDVIYLETYPVEQDVKGIKKGYFVKVLTSDAPSIDIIKTWKELREYRPFPENHHITFQTAEKLVEVFKNKNVTTFEDLENMVKLPIEPIHDYLGNIISEGDYLWAWVNKNMPDRKAYISIIFIDQLFPEGKALIKKPNIGGKKGDGKLNNILRAYRKFHPNHPINNMSYDWAEELLLGKTFHDETKLGEILND